MLWVWHRELGCQAFEDAERISVAGGFVHCLDEHGKVLAKYISTDVYLYTTSPAAAARIMRGMTEDAQDEAAERTRRRRRLPRAS